MFLCWRVARVSHTRRLERKRLWISPLSTNRLEAPCIDSPRCYVYRGFLSAKLERMFSALMGNFLIAAAAVVLTAFLIALLARRLASRLARRASAGRARKHG